MHKNTFPLFTFKHRRANFLQMFLQNLLNTSIHLMNKYIYDLIIIIKLIFLQIIKRNQSLINRRCISCDFSIAILNIKFFCDITLLNISKILTILSNIKLQNNKLSLIHSPWTAHCLPNLRKVIHIVCNNATLSYQRQVIFSLVNYLKRNIFSNYISIINEEKNLLRSLFSILLRKTFVKFLIVLDIIITIDINYSICTRDLINVVNLREFIMTFFWKFHIDLL